MEYDGSNQQIEFVRTIVRKPTRNYWLRGRGAQNAFLLCPVDLWLFEIGDGGPGEHVTRVLQTVGSREEAVDNQSNTRHGGARIFSFDLIRSSDPRRASSRTEIPVLNCASPSSHQIDDDHDQSQYQKQVDEASSNAQAKPKKPQNQEHNDERPKHNFLLCAGGQGFRALCAATGIG